VEVHLGNGWEGYAEAAPYDAAILSCAPPEVPETVLDQVRTGGRVVAPVGRGIQYLVRLVKEPHGIRREECGAVRFVPMVRHRGEA
jgi:protein-L-isoaspartate(D-aspartate) O-methyltransferase